MSFTLTLDQYNELFTFIKNTKESLKKLDSILSNASIINQNVTESLKLDSNLDNQLYNNDQNIKEIVNKNNISNDIYDSTNPTIKSEKQWLICIQNNWNLNRDHLLNTFDIHHSASFLKLLETTKAVVAGGFAVNCLFGFDLDNYTGDMDIFLSKNKWKESSDFEDFKQYFYNHQYNMTLDSSFMSYDLSTQFGISQECPKQHKQTIRLVENYKSLNKISRIVVFSKIINNIQKDIQLIFTEYDCVRSHIRTFDMSICQTFFDHNHLYTRFKYHLLTLNKVNVLLKKDVNVYEDIKYLKRIYKYQSRGFKSYFSPVLNYHFRVGNTVSPDLQTIDDAILRVSQINALFDWYKQDPQNSPIVSSDSLNGKKVLCFNLGTSTQKSTRNIDPLTLSVRVDSKNKNKFISTDIPNIEEHPIDNVSLLVDTDYKILFIDEQLKEYRSNIERTFNLPESNIKENFNISIVRDPLEYLEEKIEKNIKKIKLDDNISLELYTRELFSWLINPLRLFDNNERIGTPFKHKYTELFNTYVDVLQEKLRLLKESEYNNIQNIIQKEYMNYIFNNVKDIRWLLSLMLVYPDLFKITNAHYQSAIQNNVARDNLYIIKKQINKAI